MRYCVGSGKIARANNSPKISPSLAARSAHSKTKSSVWPAQSQRFASHRKCLWKRVPALWPQRRHVDEKALFLSKSLFCGQWLPETNARNAHASCCPHSDRRRCTNARSGDQLIAPAHALPCLRIAKTSEARRAPILASLTSSPGAVERMSHVLPQWSPTAKLFSQYRHPILRIESKKAAAGSLATTHGAGFDSKLVAAVRQN